MQITETISSGQAVGANSAQDVKKQNLDKDAFLRMLILQLRNQDPLNPMEDREFIAQLAQFSSLEQLQNISQQFQSLTQTQLAGQALSLIGRNIQALDPENGELISGVVKSVLFADGTPSLMIESADGKELEIELSNVSSVE